MVFVLIWFQYQQVKVPYPDDIESESIASKEKAIVSTKCNAIQK